MARTIQEIDADIARLQAERETAAGAEWRARWSKHFPLDLADRLVALAHEAAGRCTGEFARGESDNLVLAPDVVLWVTVDTAIEDQGDDEDGGDE